MVLFLFCSYKSLIFRAFWETKNLHKGEGHLRVNQSSAISNQ